MHSTLVETLIAAGMASWISALLLSTVVAREQVIVAGNFEVPGVWHLSLGGEFPGARGTFQLDAQEPHSGTRCGRLQGDFSKGGAYVAVLRPLDPPLPLQRLSFWARSQDARSVVVRLVDATGQTHQGTFALESDGRWHRLEVPVPKGWAHYGGANDGLFHQPLTHLWLLLDKKALQDPSQGTLWLDDVLVEVAEPVAVPSFDLLPATFQLNDLMVEATPRMPCWGIWVMEIQVENRGLQRTALSVAIDPLYLPPGQALGGKSAPLAVEANQRATAILTLPVPRSQYLPHRIRVTVQVGDLSGSAIAAMRGRQAPKSPWGTPRPARDLPHCPFGVGIHLGHPDEQLLRIAADAGLRWVRTDFMWRDFEPEPGRYVCPERIDQMVDLARSLGLEWMCLLNGGNPQCYPEDPYHPEFFARFAAFVAEHFRGRIKWFEILNEPIGQMSKHGYWQRYDQLVNAAAAAIKKVRPDAIVVPNTAYPHDCYVFLPRLSEAVDGVSLHPYPYQGIAEEGHFSADAPFPQKDGSFRAQIECLREWLAASKCGQRIALTEFGWPTYWPKDKLMTYEAVTEEAQAKYLTRRMIEAYALGCEPVLMYDLKDDFVNPNHPEAHFGLVDTGGNKKPSWWAVARVCSLLGDAKPWSPHFSVKAFFPLGGRVLRDMPRNLEERIQSVMKGLKLKNREEALKFILPPADVRLYWFRTAEGTPILALWQAVRVEGLQPFLGRVELGTTLYTEAVATDIYSGRAWAVNVVKHDKTTFLQDLPAADSPTLVQLFPSGN